MNNITKISLIFSVFLFVFVLNAYAGSDNKGSWDQCTRHGGSKSCTFTTVSFPRNDYTDAAISGQFLGHRHGGGSKMDGKICLNNVSGGSLCSSYSCYGATCGYEYGGNHPWDGLDVFSGSLSASGTDGFYVWRGSSVDDAEFVISWSADAYWTDPPAPTPPGSTLTPIPPTPTPAPSSYILSVERSSNGSATNNTGINCGTICKASYLDGARVSVRANPDPTYTVRWFGCGNVNGNDCNVLIDKDKIITVVFDPPPGSGSVCGDGVVNSGEQCDTGVNNGLCPRTCSYACTNNTCSGSTPTPGPGATPTPTTTPTPIPIAPSCLSATPDGDTVYSNSIRRVYANGVSNATSVLFPTWSDPGGQNDLIWYPGTTNDGGVTWYADINLSNHGIGTRQSSYNMNTHVYLFNSNYSDVWCDTANFISTAPVGISLSAFPTSVSSGGTVTVTWSGVINPKTTDWIGLYIPATPESSRVDNRWFYTSSCTNTPGVAVEVNGSCSFTMPSVSGDYEFRLFRN